VTPSWGNNAILVDSMKKEEFYLYLKTFIYSAVFGIVIGSIGFLGELLVGFLLHLDFSNEQIFAQNNLALSIDFLFGLVESIIVTIIYSQYFYKKSEGMNRKKVTNTFIWIQIILFIVGGIVAFAYFHFYPEEGLQFGQMGKFYLVSVVNLLVTISIFKNINNNQGKFNYKKLI
jgi:hypothetical protein